MTREADAGKTELKRALNLTLLVFYGLGITIGAGIYVLIGAIAGHAGFYAFAAFAVAAFVMLFTALSYCELTVRFPVSAGASAFVLRGFHSHGLALLTGLLVILVGLVSAAAIAAGSIGYIQQFIEVSRTPLLLIVIVGMGIIAAYGIVESAVFAAALSAIEILGLLLIITAGLIFDPGVPVAETMSAGSQSAITGILAAGLLAFFAFIGFESLANVAEEAEQPARNMPRAILLTLLVSTFLYMTLAMIAVRVVSPEDLASSPAPLSLVFQRSTGLPLQVMAAIAVLATLNGLVLQIIMVSRIMHGMSRQGNLPSFLGTVHAVTRTPLLATGVTILLVIGFAILAPLERLAETTSILSLLVFAFVDLALIVIKLRDGSTNQGSFEVPLLIPVAGLVSSLALIGAAFWV